MKKIICLLVGAISCLPAVLCENVGQEKEDQAEGRAALFNRSPLLGPLSGGLNSPINPFLAPGLAGGGIGAQSEIGSLLAMIALLERDNNFNDIVSASLRVNQPNQKNPLQSPLINQGSSGSLFNPLQQQNSASLHSSNPLPFQSSQLNSQRINRNLFGSPITQPQQLQQQQQQFANPINQLLLAQLQQQQQPQQLLNAQIQQQLISDQLQQQRVLDNLNQLQLLNLLSSSQSSPLLPPGINSQGLLTQPQIDLAFHGRESSQPINPNHKLNEGSHFAIKNARNEDNDKRFRFPEFN